MKLRPICITQQDMEHWWSHLQRNPIHPIHPWALSLSSMFLNLIISILQWHHWWLMMIVNHSLSHSNIMDWFLKCTQFQSMSRTRLIRLSMNECFWINVTRLEFPDSVFVNTESFTLLPNMTVIDRDKGYSDLVCYFFVSLGIIRIYPYDEAGNPLVEILHGNPDLSKDERMFMFKGSYSNVQRVLSNVTYKAYYNSNATFSFQITNSKYSVFYQLVLNHRSRRIRRLCCILKRQKRITFQFLESSNSSIFSLVLLCFFV